MGASKQLRFFVFSKAFLSNDVDILYLYVEIEVENFMAVLLLASILVHGFRFSHSHAFLGFFSQGVESLCGQFYFLRTCLAGFRYFEHGVMVVVLLLYLIFISEFGFVERFEVPAGD